MRTPRDGRLAHAGGVDGGFGDPSGHVFVVGYDGSDTSKAALAYAARSVGHGRLVIVHSYAPSSSSFEPDNESAGRGPLDDLAPELVGDVPHETVVVAAFPARALVQVARQHGAREIVVGARRLGLVRGGLGTVASEVLQEADRPVTVVPPGYDPEYPPL
jgi:nucleotide-binding universal stress UspA family protein